MAFSFYVIVCEFCGITDFLLGKLDRCWGIGIEIKFVNLNFKKNYKINYLFFVIAELVVSTSSVGRPLHSPATSPDPTTAATTGCSPAAATTVGPGVCRGQSHPHSVHPQWGAPNPDQRQHGERASRGSNWIRLWRWAGKPGHQQLTGRIHCQQVKTYNLFSC
jgi:hypothetical protein